MGSLNILDVFGERIINEIDKRIEKSIKDYNEIIEKRDKRIDELEEKVNKSKEIYETINITKNYISLDKKKRIVGVNPSIDKNDVIIKEELDELKSVLDSHMNDFNSFKKDIIAHVNNYNELKKDYTDFKTFVSNNYGEIKKDLDQFKKDTGTNLVNIYTKLGVFH